VFVCVVETNCWREENLRVTCANNGSLVALSSLLVDRLIVVVFCGAVVVGCVSWLS
jgi:hypothetical protein